jgi:hypothetical protein
VCALALTAVLAWSVSASAADFARPEPVAIAGYDGDLMEPFVSRDGRVLLFNNRNDPKVDTNLHWAEHLADGGFRYRGEVAGVNTPALEGVASLDADGTLYFVSTRSYDETLSTIYRGRFDGGTVSGVALVEGVSAKKPGIVNFDAEISADGRLLYAVDGDLSKGPMPRTADIFIAEREGAGFRRLGDSARILATINTPDLEYAPAISADGLELFFTRVSGFLIWKKPAVWVARRASTADPFGEPEPIDAIDGFVEAPSLGPDGKTLYYHKLVDGRFGLWRVTRD